jgi:MYXO-CTERM domain-containing protein
MRKIGYSIGQSLLRGVFGVVLLAPGVAPALEFDGMTLPVVPETHDDCNSDVWFCVNQNEDALGYDGDDIDVVETATIDQETFNPLCNLTFEVLFKGASYINVFGWYEAKSDADGNPVRPAPSEMHVMLGCDTPVGESVNLAAPDGVSEIGFFLANNGSASCVTNEDGTLQETQENLFFSQPALNDDDGRVHLLIWQSRANPTAFYFGWEDLFGGGDNDFEDLLTFVTGIQCSGGGDLCETGEPGICGQGVEQCRDGRLTCVGLQEPRDESCNALDDDCDGDVDDGDELCDVGMVCYQGKCQPRCGGGEFQCDPPLVCAASGVCVSADCVDVECGSGEVCRDGECVGACDGVECPYGHACRAGVCVDVCAGMECDDGYTCSVVYPEEMGGIAVGLCSSCGCTGCGNGFSCEQNVCVEDACLDMSCAGGFHCEAGECVDNCTDAKCPTGMKCEAGDCVEDPDYDPNGEGGEGGEGGTGNGNGNGNGISTTGLSLGGTGNAGINSVNNGQGGSSAPLADSSESDDGCGCRVAGTPVERTPWWLALPIGLAFARRRRMTSRARA